MIKGFLVVSGYRKDWFYTENEAKALSLAESCGFFEPKIKCSRWFQYINQHEAQWFFDFEKL